MKYHQIVVPHQFCYILPIGDIHIGDKNVDYQLLKSNLDWLAKTPEAYTVLMGDILNCATRISASSPFEQDMDLNKQVETAIKLFEPVRDKIIGIISGNHEQRLEQHSGYNPLIAVAHALKVPFFGISCVIAVRLKKGTSGNNEVYTLYAHHTTGGGRTIGSKLNRVDMLRQLVINADIYLGGHNHQLAVAPANSIEIDHHHGRLREKRQVIVDCGAYLKWDGAYCEAEQLIPTKLGSPRIRLEGGKKDVHVSV